MQQNTVRKGWGLALITRHFPVWSDHYKKYMSYFARLFVERCQIIGPHCVLSDSSEDSSFTEKLKVDKFICKTFLFWLRIDTKHHSRIYLKLYQSHLSIRPPTNLRNLMKFYRNLSQNPVYGQLKSVLSNLK